MPKISKESFQVRINGNAKYFQADIMYTSKGGYFYISVPEEFKTACELLTDEEKNKYFIGKVFEGKNPMNSAHSFMITGSSEMGLKNQVRSSFEFLANLTKKTREVIVVYFRKESIFSSTDQHQNKEHPKAGLEMGLLYCTEIRIGDAEPIFSQGERRVSLGYQGHKTTVILDDTPENRAFLEHTYSMVIKLRERMAEFFGDGEALLGLIKSNQKLIG